MTVTITSDTARLPLLLAELRLPTVAKLWNSIGAIPRSERCGTSGNVRALGAWIDLL
jgi:hypothetical protein